MFKFLERKKLKELKGKLILMKNTIQNVIVYYIEYVDNNFIFTYIFVQNSMKTYIEIYTMLISVLV